MKKDEEYITRPPKHETGRGEVHTPTGGETMRSFAIALALAVMLSLVGSMVVLVTGDIRPGQNGTLMRIAGDVGPGEH